MNFQSRLLPTSMEYAFSEEGYYVWCGTLLRHNGIYYLIYSRWQHEHGFEGWVTHSEICLAKTDSLLGRFTHVRVLFGNEVQDGERLVFHNPTAIEWHGKYYLYYMTTRGTGDWWTHRNRQRIGVAYATSPEGEWTRAEEPVIDVSEAGFDSLMVSNPTALITPDDRILMVYKAVSKDGEMPIGGKVVCGVATASSPLGPFCKSGHPIMENPNHPWSVEDPYVWREGGRYYALVKDFHGYFTRTPTGATALFESEDGFDFRPAAHPLAFERTLYLADESKEVFRLERPQLYMEDGAPKCLLCACLERENAPTSFNIRIPLRRE